MYLLCFSLFFVLVPAFGVQTGPEKDFYYAAVVEYCPTEGKSGNETVWKNGVEFVRLIEKASETVDIVVFPETAINFEDYSVYMEVPFGTKEIAPVDNSRLHPVLRLLSKAARDNHVYVSVCVLEEYGSTSDKIARYNTNVVFDRNGHIVSRYRKFNLYDEGHLNITKEPEISIFETDFGVRFGVFICADIFFKTPALKLVFEKNVTDIIYPSWGFAELPFLTSQIQFGWSYMTNVNLLASGVNSLGQGSTGSGIYAGKKGPLVFIINDRNETRILAAKVYKKGKRGEGEGTILKPLTEGVDTNHEIIPEDRKYYGTYLITPVIKDDTPLQYSDGSKTFISLNKIVNETICQGSLCCEFFSDMTFTYRPLHYFDTTDLEGIKNDSSYRHHYRLAAFNGNREYNSDTAGMQECAVISCLNESLSSCGHKTGNAKPLIFKSNNFGDIFLYSTSFNNISIRSITQEKTDLTFPNILESSNNTNPRSYGSVGDPSKLTFYSNETTSELSYSTNRLMILSIYSRIVSRDGGRWSPGVFN